jgi:hypothetical protein
MKQKSNTLLRAAFGAISQMYANDDYHHYYHPPVFHQFWHHFKMQSFILANMMMMVRYIRKRSLGNRLVVLCPFPNVCDDLW